MRDECEEITARSEGLRALQRYTNDAWRWDHDPDLNFPKPIRIRSRKYRDERELDAFDECRKRATAA